MPTRTYLELTRPEDLRAAPAPSNQISVHQVDDCAPSFWRRLYSEVGSQYHWVDRLGWTDDEIRAYLGDPAVSLWVLSVDGGVAGYFELRKHDEPSASGPKPQAQGPDFSVEIAYFGLLPSYVGRGLGKYLLSEAASRAWDLQPARVWLHTSTLDHPAALPNYTARGFTIFRTEEYS
jgi:ribosomal protein S18 acetylase RimI-like enzyme